MPGFKHDIKQHYQIYTHKKIYIIMAAVFPYEYLHGLLTEKGSGETKTEQK